MANFLASACASGSRIWLGLRTLSTSPLSCADPSNPGMLGRDAFCFVYFCWELACGKICRSDRSSLEHIQGTE
ncbi:hypothetical protein BJX62DRAFT_220299 [Aspergillus germanicus]